MVNKLIYFLLIIYGLVQISCTKPSTSSTPPPDSPPPSSAKSISSFVFTISDNPVLTAEVVGIIVQDTIKATFPYGTSLISLIPTITFTGRTLNPINRSPQNFTNLVTYTVGAEDGTVKNYFVICKTLQDTSKNITSFIFKSTNNPVLQGDINGVIYYDSITLVVPFGTNITSLIPTITISGVSILPANLSPQNFNSPINYVVTAADGSTKSYKVIVNVGPNSGTLYINSAHSWSTGVGNIYAIDVNTGFMKWYYTTSTSSLVSSSEFSNGVLYFGMANSMAAFDTLTRNFKWQYATGGRVYSTPTLVNGTVFFNCDDHYMYALNASTGSLKWRYKQDSVFGGGYYSSPTVVNGVVYFGSNDGHIYAVDAISGNLRWRTFNTYAPGGKIQSSPSVVNNILYIGDNFHNILALNTSDGSFKWVYQTNGLVFSSPTVVNGIVYAACSNGQIYAVDANTGNLRWTYGTGAAIYASPIVEGGTVYAGQNTSNSANLYAIDAVNGTLRWNYHNSDILYSSPVVFNDVVYVGSLNSLIAVNANTGILKWKFYTIDPLEDFRASPCIVDKQGNVFVSGISGSKN